MSLDNDIFFSYAWGDEKDESREKIVNDLYLSLLQNGYNVVRDKHDLNYKGYISDFMTRIGKGKNIVVAVSQKYFKSPYCMFELYEIARNSGFDKYRFSERVIPIMVEFIDFKKPEILEEYFSYWESEFRNWDDLVTNRSVQLSIEQLHQFDKTKMIWQNFGKLIDWIIDMNTLNPSILSENNFDKIRQALKESAHNRKIFKESIRTKRTSKPRFLFFIVPVGVVAIVIIMVYIIIGEKTKHEITDQLKFSFETIITDDNGMILQIQKNTVNQLVEDLGNGTKLEMVAIPGGTFEMGTDTNEIINNNLQLEILRYFEDEDSSTKAEYSQLPFSETPKHVVTLNKFHIGKFEITQKQWRQIAKLPAINYILSENPSVHLGENKPVDNISFRSAMEFCARLSILTGKNYRLPTEAEWEYACRAGSTSSFCFGKNIQPGFINFNGRFQFGSSPRGLNRGTTIAVGSLGYANNFGVYDMPGNVWEWCLDRWHNNYLGSPPDGSAWLNGGDREYRVVRGGSWYWIGYGCRSAYRNRREESENNDNYPDGTPKGNHGLRIVLQSD